MNVKGSYDTSDSYSDGKDTVTKSTHVGIENFSLENKAFIKNVGDEKVSTNFNDLEIAEELKLNAKNIEFKSVSPSYDYKEDGSYTLSEVTSEFKLNELSESIDISDLEPGMYIIRITGRNGVITKSIIKTKN